MKNISFWTWLSQRHPEVRLTAMQERWVTLLCAQVPAIYSGPRFSGRSFLLRLVAEYFKEIAE